MTNTKIMRQLLEVTKVQILKVIHNVLGLYTLELSLLEITKIQILKVILNKILFVILNLSVVSNHKDTNFESNSQQVFQQDFVLECCFKSQRYKF